MRPIWANRLDSCARDSGQPFGGFVSLDQKFTASLEKAWSSANPLDPVDEEIVLNWVALYSEDKPNDYGDKIREKTGSKIYDAAIKRRVYRKGLRVAEKFQKPKPKPQ